MKYLTEEDMKDWSKNELTASLIVRDHHEIYFRTKKGRVFSLDDFIDLMETIINTNFYKD